MRKPIPQRITARVEQNGECLNWTGGRNNRGYGSIGIGDKKTALVQQRAEQAAAWDRAFGGLLRRTA